MMQSRQNNPPGYGGKKNQRPPSGKTPKETPSPNPRQTNEPPPQPWTPPWQPGHVEPPGEGAPGGHGHPAFPPPFGPFPAH